MKPHVKTLLLTLLTFVLLTGCSRVDDKTILAARNAVNQGAVIVDVRTPKEFQKGHVANALNIPIETLSKSLQQVPKNRIIVVYCASGNRSGSATKLLTANGWTVYDVATQGDYERKIEPKK